MSKLQLTPDELKLVQIYARMQTGIKPRWPVWLIEIGAPLALAIYGLAGHKPHFLGAAIGGLIVMNANRMFRQFKYAHQLKSICSKVEQHVTTESANA
jgi:hypothetical protein